MKIKFCFFFLVFQQYVLAQEISGIISNKNGNPIENATVSIWSSENKESLLSYVYTNEKGFYSFLLKPNYKTVFIEVSSLEYAKKTESITISGLIQKIDFILEPEEIELKEVIIKDEKAIRVKNDTTFYDPKKFLNGSEKKVEDLIKKLPGMTVNAITGEIKYKGKSIETVQLEGDDLFGGNYSIGTKNISVDIVEQVQAIENYNENPLLNGITDSDKVAINLKLKKQKTVYSASSSLSNGFGDKLLFYDDISLLGISKKIKSFGLGSYNNFGGGLIDINSFAGGFNSSDTPENNFYSKKTLSEPTEASSLPNNRNAFDNAVIANYNIIYKLSDKISFKNNFVFYNKNSKNIDSFKNNYFLSDNSIVETSQENSYNNKDINFKEDIKFIYKLNKKSLLVSNVSVSKQVQNSSLNTIQNITSLFENNLQTDNLFFKAKTNYTLKLSDKKALQFLSEFSKNEIPQQVIISPSNSFFTSITGNESIQNSNFSKQVFNNKITFLENRNKLKQTFSLAIITESNPFFSNLNVNNGIVNDFKNDLIYKKSNVIFEYFTTYLWKKIKIQPYISSNFLNQYLNSKINATIHKKSDLVYNGSVLLTFKVNKFSDVFINANSENNTPEEDFLFTNKIAENNFTLKNNIASLDLLKTQSFNFGYKYYNITKQFGFETNLQFQKKQNTFLSNITVSPNFTSINYFQNPANINNTNLVVTLDKQIRSLRLYIKQGTTLSIGNYKNAIEDFVLRDNVCKTLNVSTLLFSNFNFPVNFENTFNYSLSNFRTNNEFSNQRVSINNVFKLIAKPINRWVFSISQDFFVNDVKLNNHFNFFDFDIKYKSSKLKWLSINFIGKNLSNINIFSEVNNNDFSTSIYKTNLLPRYFLISTNLSF